MEYEKLNKKAIYCMFFGTLVGLLVLLAIIFGVYLGLKSEISDTIFIIFRNVLIVTVIFAIIYLFVSPIIRYNRYKYKINEEEVDVIEGLWFITRTIVPIERLHKITLQRGPIDNIFGLSKVIITTAGGDAIIRFLENEKAEKIAESLKTKVNEIAKNGVK